MYKNVLFPARIIANTSSNQNKHYLHTFIFTILCVNEYIHILITSIQL